MTSGSKPTGYYIHDFFETNSLDGAKNLILTSNHSMTTEQRWETETPLVGDAIIRELQLSQASVVLDYGCGIGRLAKYLIDKIGCRVIGVDISTSMRSMAIDYVGSPQFSVASFEEFDALIQGGLRVHHAYAVWVLQHSPEPNADIRRIRRALSDGGRFYFLNARGRCVPCDIGWVNDGVNVFQQIREHHFQEIRKDSFDFYGKDQNSSEVPLSVTYTVTK